MTLLVVIVVTIVVVIYKSHVFNAREAQVIVETNRGDDIVPAVDQFRDFFQRRILYDFSHVFDGFRFRNVLAD